MHRSGGLAAIILGGILALGAGVGAVGAREQTPPTNAPEAAPLGYTPRFVTQTDESPPWDDCLWASAAMLLDKWTGGQVRPDRRELRRASGDFEEGSTFVDLARAVSKLYGWKPKWSPRGGDPMTWDELLQRLANGGGAIIAGDYGRLGAPYTRWSRSYAANPQAAGHAMYVDRYDAERQRMWIMDPLGRRGYGGEWVPVERVRAFIWMRGQKVHAVATPAAPVTSDSGWLAGPMTLAAGSHRAGETVSLNIPIVEPGPWTLPDLELSASWEIVTPDGWIPARVPERLRKRDRGSPPERVALSLVQPEPTAVDGAEISPQQLTADVTLPDQPGVWRLTANVARRDGVALPETWVQAPLDVRVWGDRGAVVLPIPAVDRAPIKPGGTLDATVMIENAGRIAWTGPALNPVIAEVGHDVTTELYVTWVALDGGQTPALEPMALSAASAEQLTFDLRLVAPSTAGTYSLRFDVRDHTGSLLAPDSLPVDVPLTVTPAHGSSSTSAPGN